MWLPTPTYPFDKLAMLCISSSYVKYSLQSDRNWSILLSHGSTELVCQGTTGTCWVPGKK